MRTSDFRIFGSGQHFAVVCSVETLSVREHSVVEHFVAVAVWLAAAEPTRVPVVRPGQRVSGAPDGALRFAPDGVDC